MSATATRPGVITLANQILNSPEPAEAIGRVVKMMDHQPIRLPNGTISPEVKAAIKQGREWADTPDNLVASCKPCNTSKGAKTQEEWGWKI